MNVIIMRWDLNHQEDDDDDDEDDGVDHLADLFVVDVEVAFPHPQEDVVHTLCCEVYKEYLDDYYGQG